MKGAKGDMEIILMFFLKDILFGAVWSFWPKNCMMSSKFWICSQVFLLPLHNKNDQLVHKNIISLFFKKKSHMGQIDIFWLFPYVLLGVVKIEPGHCY